MEHTMRYTSPLGGILLAADGEGLCGLWFEGAKYFAAGLSPEQEEGSTPILDEARRWLDMYFAGREPDFMPPLHAVGTPFQTSVWDALREIPYGSVTSYGGIARSLAAKRGLTHLSAQAVGGAVGRNRISIIIPCHRVLGSTGALTGYAGGVERKAALLRLEGVDGI